MPQGVLTKRIDTVRPEHTPEAMGRPPRKDDHGGEVYVYRRAGMALLGMRLLRYDRGARWSQPVLVWAVPAARMILDPITTSGGEQCACQNLGANG
jgi:hypothetical protein